MAVAIRGTTPATTIGTGDPTSITLNGTRQPNTDDVLIIIHGNDFYALSAMPTPTVGGSSSGVTTIVNADGGSNQAHIKSWYYVVGSTADLTVSVNETGPADEEKGLVVYVLSGVDTAAPIDVSAASTDTGGTTHICPSVSPTSSDAFLICHTNPGGGTAPGSYTPPGGMTDQYDTAITAFAMAGATEQLAASGATGTRTFTPNTSETDNAEISIAVKTAAGAAAGQRYPTVVETDPAVRAAVRAQTRPRSGPIVLRAPVPAAVATSAPAGLAGADGTGLQPAVRIAPTSGAASAIGSGLQPAVKVAPVAGAASATGTALQPTIQIRVNAGLAAGTGDAPQPTITTSAETRAIQPVVVVPATQTALLRRRQATAAFVDFGSPADLTGDVTANAGIASAAGSALQPTISVSGSTNAPAGVAAATGTAGQPAIAIAARAAAPTAAGTALQPTAAVKANAAAPAGAGTAPQPTVSISGSTNALAGLASATGTAGQPAIAVKANTAAPTAAGSGHAATIRTGRVAFAAVASAVGSAFTAIAAITARPSAAFGLGTALQPTTTAEVIVRLRTLALYSSRTFGADGYHTGENQIVFLPNHLRIGAPLVVVCHGTASEASWYYEARGRWRPLEAIADTGMVVVAGDLGEPAVPDGWGNDTSVARVDEVISWAAAEFGCATSRVSFLGDSAGGATALNWARQNTAQVAGIALRAGVADIDAVYTTNAFLATLIDQAYAGDWAASKATHDPALNTADLVPIADRIRCYYTSGDDLIPPASTLAFCTDVGCAAVPIGDFVHSDEVHTSIHYGDLASWLWSLI